jgi:serine/threonine protein kinase
VRDFPVREKVVTVAVNPGYTLASLGRGYWPCLLGGLILATGTLVVVRRRVRGRAVAPAGPTRDGSIPRSEETRTVEQLTSQEPADHPPTQPAAAQPTPAHPVIASTPGELAPGMLVHNRYQLVQLIGRGGMGAVYAAIDQRLNSRVALKHLLVTGGQLDAAFAREAQILATLRHPALPRVTDYFQEEQGRFLVMEYFAGDNLADRLLQQAGPLPVAAVLAWADQILAALEYLHGYTPPVLHRDIKPQNLKLTPEGQVILLDFGLAKGAVEQQTAVDSVSSVFGYTAHYAPPEQIQGSGTEPRSDLYALAATLYHLLTNQRPPTALERIVAIQNELPDPLQPISAINPAVPAAVEEVLHRALSLKLSERPASAAAMREGL